MDRLVGRCSDLHVMLMEANVNINGLGRSARRAWKAFSGRFDG